MAEILDHADYTILWLALLPIEAEAALGVLDTRHQGLFQTARGDDYLYIGGEINGHNVVIATWPVGQNYGVGSAAALVNQVKIRFPNIIFALLVGIAAGLPNLTPTTNTTFRDIRLGDVLVCVPDQACNGIIQYDLGRDTVNGFVPNGRHAETPAIVRSAIMNIQLTKPNPFLSGKEFAIHLDTLQKSAANDKFRCPSQTDDKLFAGDFAVLDSLSQPAALIERQPRLESERTLVWYGTIGSGNSVVKNSRRRDELRDRYDLIGLEMEAAGVMNTLPTGVIRGVSDYGDSHKTKEWQPYAAAVAAVYAKGILTSIRPENSLRPQGRINKSTTGKGLGLNLGNAPQIEQSLFTGRATELKTMQQLLQPDLISEDRRIIVLGGMGGIGKTQLAIAYAKQSHAFYGSTFFLDATSEVALKTSLRLHTRRMLAVDEERSCDDDQIRERFSRWLSESSNFCWLLVFDNFDDTTLFDIEDYYPSVSQGAIIVTTRSPDLVKGHCIRIEPLSDEEESLFILESRSGRRTTSTDPDARKLAKRLGGLPLALATAGAFLKQSSVSFRDYLDRYELKWNIAPKRFKGLPEYQGRTLYTTWNLSLSQIERQEPDAARLLTFFAYLGHQSLSYALLSCGTYEDCPSWFRNLVSDLFDFESVAGVLVDFCLVDARYETATYSLHICVHDWTLDGLNQILDPVLFRLAVRCVTGYLETNPPKNTLSGIAYAQLVPHAKRIIHERFKSSLMTKDEVMQANVNDMNHLALLLQRQMEYEAAEQMYLQILLFCEKKLGEDHPSTLYTLDNLGTLFVDRGKMKEAEEKLLKALEGKERVQGPDHVETLNAVHSLGVMYATQENLTEAERMYTRALSKYTIILEEDHHLILGTMHNLGEVYFRQGRLDKAIEMFQKALEGYKRTTGLEDPSTLMVMKNLAIVYKRRGKKTEAEDMTLQALAGMERSVGLEHRWTLEAVYSVGAMYHDQGKSVEAEQMYKRALEGNEKVLGPNHELTLAAVNALGKLFLQVGRMAEADKMLSRALTGCQTFLGDNHTWTFEAILNMGNFLSVQGKTVEADQLLRPGLARCQRVLGLDHVQTLAITNCLGCVARQLNNLPEAQELVMEANDRLEQTRGMEDYKKSLTTNNLGTLCAELQAYEVAHKLLTSVTNAWQNLSGLNRASYLVALSNLAIVCRHMGKSDDAQQMSHRALEGLKEIWHPEHPHLERVEKGVLIDILNL